MPFNWNFGNDDLNNRQDRNNENRPAEPKGDPADPPRDKSGVDVTLAALVQQIRTGEGGIPPFLDLYLNYLRLAVDGAFGPGDAVKAQKNLRFFEDFSTFLTRNPDQEIPEDGIERLRMFIEEAYNFRDSEEFERERQTTRNGPDGGLEIVAEEDTRAGKLRRLMQAGVALIPPNDTDEDIDRALNRVRRRRIEARERRRQRERESRLFPEQQEGPQGRTRTIMAKRPIGDATLDPITRYYHLNFQAGSAFTKPSDDALYRVVVGDMQQRAYAKLSMNQVFEPSTNQVSQIARYRGTDLSIANDRVNWSLGGYAFEQMPMGYQNAPQQINKWNFSFTAGDNGVVPRNADENPPSEQELAGVPRNLFTSNEGGEFGQVEQFNFPARMNDLALAAFPDPVEYFGAQAATRLINASFRIPAEGQPYPQADLLKMQKMLGIGGWQLNVNSFLRAYAEDERFNINPYNSDGYVFYRAIRDYFNITEGSVKDRLLFMAGLSSSSAREVIENTFVSYSFYNFKAYTGVARDLYGHKMAEAGGSFDGSIFGYIDPEYNYFDAKYETATAGSSIPHALLPNFYTYIIASNTTLPETPDNGSVDFLGGDRASTIRSQAIQQITLGEFSEQLLPSLGDENVSSYLDSYAEAIGSGLVTSLGSQLTRLYRNLGVPAGEIDIFNRLNSRSKTFPMCMKIGVPTGPIGPIGALIEQTGTSTSIMNILVETSTVSEEFQFKCNAYQAPVNPEDPFDVESPENGVQLANLAIRRNSVVYDFDTWIEGIQTTSENIASIQTGGNSYRAGGERMPNEVVTLSGQHFVDNLKLAVKSKADEVTVTYVNLLSSVYESTESHSETFMYKLKKFTTNLDGAAKTLVNEFYFPNTQLSEIIEYVDTQIKYEQTYQYELVGYELVFGSEFKFRTNAYESSGGGWPANVPRALYFDFYVETLPNIKVIEYPIFTKEWNEENILNDNFGGGVSYPLARVVDNPPVQPNAFIYPYKDNYRQVLMNFQPMNDNRVEKYIAMTDAEKEQFENISKTQKRLTNFDLEKGSVRFKNEGLEEIHSVQVFRSETIEPHFDEDQSLYDNFKGKLYATILQEGGLDLVDTLVPNQKYYYMFRSVDRHNQVSNPSEIYEVMLSYSEGVYIPKIKLYNPEKTLVQNTKPSKKMARFIEIKAADIQSLTFDERNDTGDLVRSRKGLVSEEDDKVTESKFLVRLVSRDTGRKINIVVDFRER